MWLVIILRTWQHSDAATTSGWRPRRGRVGGVATYRIPVVGLRVTVVSAKGVGVAVPSIMQSILFCLKS